MFGPNGLPEIDIALDIDGRGATIRRRQSAVCSEQGTPPFRLFYVAGALSPGLGQGSLTLRNLTLAGGFAFGAAGGAAQINDPVKGRASFGGGGGAAGLGGAIFAHGSVVLSAVSVVDSCAQGGMGGLGLAESKYGGGGGGGLGGAGGSPVAAEPSNVTDSKYGGGGGGFRTSGGSAGQGGVFVVDGARPDKPAGAYGPGESAVTLKTAAEPGGKGLSSASAAAVSGALGGGSRGLGGLGGTINVLPGRYSGDGGSGGQLAGSSGTCGGGGGAGFGGDGGQYIECTFLTGTLPRAAGGGGAFGGGGGGGDGRGPGGGGGVGGGGGGAGLGGDVTLGIGGGGGGFGGGGGGGGARGGNGGFGGGGGAGEDEPGLPGFGGGAGTRSTDCVFGGQPGTGGGGGGLGAGGAIFVHGGSLSVANSTFANNRARGGAASGGKGTCAEPGHGFGGALFSLNGTVTLVNVSAVANEVGGGVANSGGGVADPDVLSFDDGRAFASISLGTNDAAASLTLQNTLISSNAGAQSTAGDVVLLAKAGTSTLLATAPNLMERQPKSMRDTGGALTPAKLVAETSGVRQGTVELQVSGGLYAPQAAASGLLTGDAATCQQAPVSGVDQRGVARSPSACTLGAVETIPYTRPESPPCVPSSPGCGMTPVGPANAALSRLLVAASFALSTLLVRRRRRSRGA